MVAVALSGCVGDDEPLAGGGLPDLPPLLARGLNGTQNHQLTAHPAWGWPTMVDLGPLVGAWNLTPYRPLPETIQDLKHVAHVEGGNDGSGIAIWGTYAFNSGGGGGNPGTVVDLSDPANPVVVAQLEGDPETRDADILAYPDGRVVLVTATNSDVLPLYDVTDPRNPLKITDVQTTTTSHNIAVVPGTPIVYNANSAGGGSGPFGLAPTGHVPDLGGGLTEIFDLSDPENPRLVAQWPNGYGCHDITFYINPDEDKFRAYCAGIEMTQIWDIADPTRPRVVANIPVHHGVAGAPSGSVFLLAFSHLAMVNHDATILIVGDETGGGALAGCDVYTDAAGRTLSGPLGNLWFYDITDETDPQLRGWLSPSSTLVAPEAAVPFAWWSCTAHFGRLVEDRNQLVMAFYGAGTVLVDFSDPASPVIVDVFDEGSMVWDAWYYQGYVVTGDLNRGMDILTFE